MKPASMIRLLGALGLITATTFVQAEPGNLMKITIDVKMRMPGMTTAQPHTHTYTKCVSTRKPDPREVMDQKHCTLSNYTWNGDEINTHVSCSAPVNMHGDVHFKMSSGSIQGDTHMTATLPQGEMKVEQTIEGERVGGCNYTH